jgi:hypothetical protein
MVVDVGSGGEVVGVEEVWRVLKGDAGALVAREKGVRGNSSLGELGGGATCLSRGVEFWREVGVGGVNGWCARSRLVAPASCSTESCGGARSRPCRRAQGVACPCMGGVVEVSSSISWRLQSLERGVGWPA